MAYIQKDNYPSIKTPGVYPSGSIKELGLDNDDLEKLSLGTWNSIVKDNKIFKGITDALFMESLPIEGKSVQVGFEEPDELELNVIRYEKDANGDIISNTIELVESYRSISNIPEREWIGDGGNYWSQEKDNIRNFFFDTYKFYYAFNSPFVLESTNDTQNNGGQIEQDNNTNFATRTFKQDKIINRSATLAFIKPREPLDITSPLEFEPIDSAPFENLILEREKGISEYELIFPSVFQFKNPNNDNIFDLPTSNIPPLSAFFEMDISDQLAPQYFGGNIVSVGQTPELASIGGTEFEAEEYGNPVISQADLLLDDTVSNVTGSAMNVDEVKFIVRARTEEQNEFLYHDRLTSLKYYDTSYPVEVTLNLSFFDYPDFYNSIQNYYGSGLGDRGDFFLNMANSLPPTSINDQLSYFTYQVIQWGDEKVLLTDDQIEQTYFFSLYDQDEYPEPDSYIFKKWVTSHQSEVKEIGPNAINETSHVYNTPGVKSIKIVVYRYGRDKSILGQTYLVTRNIVINDGNLLSQDFSIFGGSDFNFLPLKSQIIRIQDVFFPTITANLVAERVDEYNTRLTADSLNDIEGFDLEKYIIDNSYENKRNIIINGSPAIQGGYGTTGAGESKNIEFITIRNDSYDGGFVVGDTYEIIWNIKNPEGRVISYPLQAIIGGLDEDSKYNNSVERIKKDDNFIEEDYLERASSRDFIDNFNKKLYGETPGQLDLSTTRVYKKPLDIYDFITNDKQSIVDNNFNINTLPINSSATDIFISNNDCIVDLNPQDIEYLSIQNKTGTADKAILIGDYKVNQPKDGKIQRQGVMETPLLEQNTDKQAF